MLKVIDTNTSQRNLDFSIPIAEGYRSNYIKLGGDNVPRYVAPWYLDQNKKTRDNGYDHVGHYWVPSAARDPEDAAEFFVSNVADWTETDFLVLDNESLDGAQRYGDDACAAFIEKCKSLMNIGGDQVLTYSGLSDARNTVWTKTLATGTNFIIAAYSYAPFAWDAFPSIPADRIVGHQTGGKAFGGVVTDINVFKDHAFNFGGGSNGGGSDVVLTDEDVNRIADAVADRIKQINYRVE